MDRFIGCVFEAGGLVIAGLLAGIALHAGVRLGAALGCLAAACYVLYIVHKFPSAHSGHPRT